MGQFSGGQFAGGQFAGGQFSVGAAAGGCEGVYYANRSDIELLYGSSNVAKWADVNNDGNLQEIEDRICWSLQNAHAEMDDRMLGGPFVVPFVAPYPRQVITTTARMAGLLLYDSRGITDFSETGVPKHQLFYHVRMVKEFFEKVLSGKMRLMGQVSAITYPGAYIDTDDDVTAPFTF